MKGARGVVGVSQTGERERVCVLVRARAWRREGCVRWVERVG